MANTYIKRTQVAGDRQKFTFSAWVKRGAIGTNQQILSCYHGNSDSGYIELRFQGSGDSLHCSGYSLNWFRTNRTFRDTNGFYHIVYAVDTTQATSGNRMKLYVNGVEETSFVTQTQPSQNLNLPFGENGSDIRIGVDVTANAQFFDGSMSHVHFCDGYQYQPSDFGSTDATTGEWKINTSPSVSYGNNGFFILKDGNSVTDQSGQSHNCTVAGGTLTKTEDSPSNVFATWNKLDWGTTYFTLTNGSTTAQSNASVYTYGIATLGVNSGKFYWEVEYDAKNGGDKFPQIGITSTQTTNTQYELGHYANDWCYYISETTANLRNNNSNTNWGTEYVEGDIIGVALDCTNNKLYFSKNGTWQESGDPSAGNNGISITAPSSTPLGFYFPAICYYDGTHRGTFKANFGNGYFGTTAVSSAGSNASGNGIFEYDVPTGFTALSTKGLNL